MASEALTNVLDEAGVQYDVLPHPHTERAADEAKVLGLSPGEVAKTIVVSTSTGNVRAVLSASDRLDVHKLGEIEGGSRKHVHLLSEDVLASRYPDFELGAVPPMRGPNDAVVVDRRVAERESVVVEAGDHDSSLRILTADLIRLTGARVADIAED